MLNIFTNFVKNKIMEYTVENIQNILALTKEGKRELLDSLSDFHNNKRL